MKDRLITEIRKLLIFCGIGFLYYLWILHTNIYIPCIFKAITGFKCPGCGISHMFMALCQLDFHTAFHKNEFLFITLPAVAVIYIVCKIYYIKTNAKMPKGKLMKFLEYSYLAMLLIFAIARNIK